MIEAFYTYFQNGFGVPWLEQIFWVGALPTLFLVVWIDSRYKSFPKVLNFSVIVWVLVWIGRLFVITWQYANGIMDAFFGLPVLDVVVLRVVAIYGELDSYLSPATGYTLLITPLAIILMVGDSKIKPKLILSALNIWVAVSFLALFAIGVDIILDNPYSIILFAAIVPIINLYGFSTSINLKKGYSKETFFRDIKIARNKTTNDRSSTIIRGLTLIAVLTSFWFYLTIDAEALIAYYAAIIAGLLAVVGFAALVFTFTYEKLPTPRLRRQIGVDTRSAQTAAGLTLISAVAGLLLIDDSLTLNVRPMDWIEIIRVTVLFFSVVGFVFAIDGILILFHHIVDIMIEVDPRETSMSVIFEERSIQKHLSANSTDVQGHADMRAYMEEAGCSVLVAKEILWSAMVKLKKTIIVFGPRLDAYNPQEFEGLHEFVEQGDILIIMTNSTDLSTKADLLSCFGIFPTVRSHSYWGAAIDLKNREGKIIWQERHNAHISLNLRPDPSDIILVETASLDPDQFFVSEPLIYAKRVGKGAVIVVGSLYLWTNQNLQKDRTYRILDRVVQFAEAHFVQHDS